MRDIDYTHPIHSLEDKTTFKCKSLSPHIDFLHLLLSVLSVPHKQLWTNKLFPSLSFGDVPCPNVGSLHLDVAKNMQALSIPPLSTLGLSRVIHWHCWIEVSRGPFTPANRDVCTWPGGLELVEWPVLLLRPPAKNTKESSSARLISPLLYASWVWITPLTLPAPFLMLSFLTFAILPKGCFNLCYIPKELILFYCVFCYFQFFLRCIWDVKPIDCIAPTKFKIN